MAVRRGSSTQAAADTSQLIRMDAALHALSLRLLHSANEQPPLLGCTGERRSAAAGALDSCRAVLAAFPPLPSASAAAASTEEMAELLRLLRHQLAGERSAHAARVAGGRLLDKAAAAPVAADAELDEAQALMGRLACSALTYSWTLFGIEVRELT